MPKYCSCSEPWMLQLGAGKWLWRYFLLSSVEFSFILLKILAERQELVPDG